MLKFSASSSFEKCRWTRRIFYHHVCGYSDSWSRNVEPSNTPKMPRESLIEFDSCWPLNVICYWGGGHEPDNDIWNQQVSFITRRQSRQDLPAVSFLCDLLLGSCAIRWRVRPDRLFQIFSALFTRHTALVKERLIVDKWSVCTATWIIAQACVWQENSYRLLWHVCC